MTRFFIKVIVFLGVVSFFSVSHADSAARKFARVSAVNEVSSAEFERDKARAKEYLTHKVVLSAVKLYREMQGRLPEKVADLSDTLFFSVPLNYIKGWNRAGNRLEVSFDYLGSGKEDRVKIIFYEPGSPEDIARREREIETALSTVIYRMERSVYTGERVPYTISDVREGRYPVNGRDRYRLYSRTEQEYFQLIWAGVLARILEEALSQFHKVFGYYPEKAQELFTFIGQPNKSAWVAPLTGDEVGISTEWNGKDVAYHASPDKKGYELLVPLLGAGIDKPIDPKAREWDKYFRPGNGYVAGKYFRVSKNFPRDSHSYVFSPL